MPQNHFGFSRWGNCWDLIRVSLAIAISNQKLSHKSGLKGHGLTGC
jgi:hypothetical protein